MGRLSVRKQLERQKQEALKQLNDRHEELENVKRQYSEMLRTGKKPEVDMNRVVQAPMI